MQAIILAAGMGKRLKGLTQDNTKCMIEVNGVSLIYRMLHQIDERNLNRIIIVVGYQGRKLIDYISTFNIKTPIEFIENPIYYKTNNIYSLSLAKEWLCKDDTLLFESDLIFEDSIIDLLLNDSRDTLALVDKYESWMDGTCVILSEEDEIKEFVPGKFFDFNEKNEYYKTVNIYKFSKTFSNTYYVPFLDAYQCALGENEYYEQVLRVITMLDAPVIKAKRLNGQRWYEIDDIQDLDIASSIFMPDEDMRVELLAERYGGYWRYPKLMDFCYLVNSYFPPKKLIDEIKSNFDTLISQYPSGMRVNSLLAAKNFGLSEDNIVVGNGAAELIKVLVESFSGKLGVIRPTFEEYGNRYKKGDIVSFWPNNDSFSYSAQDIMTYFSDKKINNLVLINPDNPSGNYIKKADVLSIIDWSKRKGIGLVVDESFVDFSDEADCSLFNQDILNENPHLNVIKSISKSYGVPGLRLGVLASGNKELISTIKKTVSIWNINSFAEFYMQIEEKYKTDYVTSLQRFRAERTRFADELKKVEGIRLIPSQSNYFMLEITCGITAKELNRRLIINHNILIKNLVAKIEQDGKQYVRIAIKTSEENNKLIMALKEELVKNMHA